MTHLRYSTKWVGYDRWMEGNGLIQLFFMISAGNMLFLATPSLEAATKLHFVFASQVKKPGQKSIFHPDEAITDTQWRAVTYSKRPKKTVFLHSLDFFPQRGLFVCDTALGSLFPDQQGRKLLSFFPTIQKVKSL